MGQCGQAIFSNRHKSTTPILCETIPDSKSGPGRNQMNVLSATRSLEPGVTDNDNNSGNYFTKKSAINYANEKKINFIDVSKSMKISPSKEKVRAFLLPEQGANPINIDNTQSKSTL